MSQSKDGVCQLEIVEVFPDNEGVYTAVATNRAGEDATDCTMAVESYVYEPDSEIGVVSGSVEDVLSEDEVPEGRLQNNISQCKSNSVKLIFMVYKKCEQIDHNNFLFQFYVLFYVCLLCNFLYFRSMLRC